MLAEAAPGYLSFYRRLFPFIDIACLRFASVTSSARLFRANTRFVFGVPVAFRFTGTSSRKCFGSATATAGIC